MRACNRSAFAKKLRETRQERSEVPKDMRPLYDHLIVLARDSFRRGYCARAGRELYHARRLARLR